VFGAPWEAQAFAMTCSLHGRGAFLWREWADALRGRASPRRAPAASRTTAAITTCIGSPALEKLVAPEKAHRGKRAGTARDEWDAAARSTAHGKPVELLRAD